MGDHAAVVHVSDIVVHVSDIFPFCRCTASQALHFSRKRNVASPSAHYARPRAVRVSAHCGSASPARQVYSALRDSLLLGTCPALADAQKLARDYVKIPISSGMSSRAPDDPVMHPLFSILSECRETGRRWDGPANRKRDTQADALNLSLLPLAKTIKENLDKANRENGFIYNQRIPADVTEPPESKSLTEVRIVALGLAVENNARDCRGQRIGAEYWVQYRVQSIVQHTEASRNRFHRDTYVINSHSQQPMRFEPVVASSSLESAKLDLTKISAKGQVRISDAFALPLLRLPRMLNGCFCS